jgi:hypothetical protein
VKERAVAKRCGLFLASPRTVIALRGRRISGARGLTRGKVCELTGSPLRLQPELDQAPDGCGAGLAAVSVFQSSGPHAAEDRALIAAVANEAAGHELGGFCLPGVPIALLILSLLFKGDRSWRAGQ